MSNRPTWRHLVRLTALTAGLFLVAPSVCGEVIQASPGLVSPQDQYSRYLEALSPAAAGRVARRDMMSVLGPGSGSDPVSTLDIKDATFDGFDLDLGGNVEAAIFVTSPHPSNDYPYLCREVRIAVGYKFAPQFDAAGKFLRYRRRPDAVLTQPLFHLSAVPGDTACDPHHRRTKTDWMTAPSALDAVQAANLFRVAVDDVLSGALKPGPCDPHGPQTCAQWVVSLASLAGARAINSCTPPASDEVCYIISFDAEQVTLVGKVAAQQLGLVTTTAIVSVRMDVVIGITE